MMWYGRKRLERESKICERAGGLSTIRMLRNKERFLLCMKIMREIGRQGFAKKFEAAAMKEIFDERIAGLVERKEATKERVLDELKEAVEFGIGTEKELAKRAFLILKKKGIFITELANRSDLDIDKERIFFVLEQDLPISSLPAHDSFWHFKELKDEEIQKAVRKTIKKKIKQGDYARAAEIAFAFHMEGLADGIQKSCRELGIWFSYEKVVFTHGVM